MAPTKSAEDGFLPASSTSAKSRKAAIKSASSTSTKKSNGKGKATSMFLSTQPAISHSTADDDMMDFERLPLDDSVRPSVSRTTAAEASAAMEADDMDEDEEDDSILIDPSSLSLPEPVQRIPISSLPGADALSFPAVSHTSTSGLTQRRKVSIPPHRMTPLKRDWIKIYGPLVEECGLQVRMNLKRRWVEMKVRSTCAFGSREEWGAKSRPPLQTSKHTPSPSSLTRASDFLAAYALGFSAEDAIALLRLEELYVVRAPRSPTHAPH